MSTEASAAPTKESSASTKSLRSTLVFAVQVLLVAYFLRQAYQIRLYAIQDYGKVIHEFDPWFNFRATQYLAKHGLYEFFHWFDYMAWYPLGRPVGTTIYPGMQMTSVTIWNALKYLPKAYQMSLNDVCVYVPTWGGITATFFLALLTRECSGSNSAAVASAAIMSIIPAHLMRSVGGGYDNESVAMTAMCMTFFLWCRALRNDQSWYWGIAAGLSYVYMVAAWGGYIFVLNLIGVHAGVLLLLKTALEKDISSLHKAFTLFYFIGTLGAIQIPVVGLTPLKSLEQLGSLVVFVVMQLFMYAQSQKRKHDLTRLQANVLRFKLIAGCLLLLIVATMFVLPANYFGPLSARVRGLLVKHTRTGNPLVDSVAEHQPASAQAYYQYLQNVYYVAPVGLALCVLTWYSDATLFLVLYALIAYYFSAKMVRLILLLAPVASALGGVAAGESIAWAAREMYRLTGADSSIEEEVLESAPVDVEEEELPEEVAATAAKKGGKPVKKKAARKEKKAKKNQPSISLNFIASLKKLWFEFNIQPRFQIVRVLVGVGVVLASWRYYVEFMAYSDMMAHNLSHPSLMFKARLRDGTQVMVDDYREAYWYLRDKTPKDARVMAWWDYGYQITGIGERTSIADGNTWNHEHIATLGRCLISKESEAHRMIRHLADYVLVWTGGGGDDLAKSIHIARIGNSVYPHICPNDPTCGQFGFTQDGTPSKKMGESLIYKLHSNGLRPGVSVNSTLFQEVFTSKYRKVRIYKVLKVSKKSKNWVADPANRVCDAPGSWYCRGQYPPALDPIIKERLNFQQLEDFNKKKDNRHEAYQKAYMENMKKRHGGA